MIPAVKGSDKMSRIIAEQGKNPLVNYHFLLRVDAVYDLPCRKISGFEQEIEYENIQSGGVNHYVYLRQKPTTKPYSFKVERYIGANYFDPLPVGKQPQLPILLYVSRSFYNFTKPKQTFTFTGCTVLSKSYGELDAEKSGLMSETTTIAYQQMHLVTDNDEDIYSILGLNLPGRKYQGTRITGMPGVRK